MKKVIVLVIVLWDVLSLQAQYEVNVVSPQAASLIKYVQNPVDYSRGLVDITIPIYEIGIDGKKLPISLSYHHGGIKAGELNRQLGQGWTLNAELSVVRSINGKRETPSSYMPADSDAPVRASDDYLWELASNGDSPYQDTYDEDPDDYFYKLLGRSGLFIFKKLNGELRARPIPYCPIIITPKNGNPDNGFDVVDDHGLCYSFVAKNDYYYENAKYSDRKKIQTAWKCTSINNAAKTDTISFHYQDVEGCKYNLNDFIIIEDCPNGYNNWKPGESLDLLQPTMLRYADFGKYKRFYLGKDFFDFDADENGRLDDYYYVWKEDESYTQYHWPRLPELKSTIHYTLVERIDFKGGRVEFIYDDYDRHLMEDLDEIVVYNKNDEQIKRVVFYNHYTTALPEIPSYPMLDSLKIYGNNNGQIEEIYRFTYNGDVYPGPTDPWGNITVGERSLVENLQNLPFAKADIFYKDEKAMDNTCCLFFNTESEGNSSRLQETSQRGILTSITNSLGGKTEFFYEPNYCTVTSQEYPVATYQGQDMLEFCEIPNPSTTEVKAMAGLRIRQIVHSDPLLGTKLTRTFKYGQEKQEGERYFVATHLEDRETGLGMLKRNIEATSWSINQKKVYTQLDDYGYAIEDREVRMRTFYSQLYGNTPFNRQPISYKYVTEYQEAERNGEVTHNGKTVYVYNIPDQPSDDYQAGLFCDATTYYDYKYDYMGNSLLSKTDYKGSGDEYKKIKSSTFTYTTDVVEYIPVGRVFQKIVFDGAAGSRPPKDRNNLTYCNYSIDDIFLHYSYLLPVANRLLTKQCDSVFSDYTKDALVDTYEFAYQNKSHHYLTSVKHYNSDGRLTEKIYRYPQDILTYTEATHRSAVAALKAENVISPILEEKIVTSDHTQTTYNIYQLFQGFPYFHKRLVRQDDEPLETMLMYHVYNTQGYPMHISKREGVEDVVYLWGYANMYPVAKIVGTTYEAVESILGETFINRLAMAVIPTGDDMRSIDLLREKLPSAFVTTYVYQPLVGMTQMTDPRGITTYYEYDEAGRLKRIRNRNKERTEEYDYHYRAVP